ncbi:MAG: type II toxin-antitoxin system death-on-curing family toxin [Bacteroidota bacterium]
MNIIYITIEQAVATHKQTVKVSGGGSDGVLDAGRLESVLQHIQNDDYYPTFEDKLTHLIFASNKFHCFQDGNKRISISLGAQFLLLNGYVFIVGKFIQEMENISYHIASGKISKELLKEIIISLINEPEFSESLRLKIFNSIAEN